MTFFEKIHQDKNCRARAGVMHTDHGDIETPVFMPVGTQAAVKTLDSNDLNTVGAQIILGNNYHLHLRPGEDLIAGMGGLHKFMNWDKPILTDSGGFQVFSLGLQKKTRNKKQDVIPSRVEGSLSTDIQDDNQQGDLVSIDEDGVTFKSHIDGSTHRFTPESAIECEHKIGADIIMAFDECTPDEIPEEYAREAMDRTHRWAKRSLEAHHVLSSRAKRSEAEGSLSPNAYKRFLFGIIQGAKYKNLREESAKYITSLDFDGIAIGGESIGYNMEVTKDILQWVAPYLPEDKPRYTMGVGLDPTDLLQVVEQGIDMFDCVAPTRLARHGVLFCHCEERGTSDEAISGDRHGLRPRDDKKKHRLNIRNSAFAKDPGPIDPQCQCPTCKSYSRAYLHHLFDAQEMTAMRLATIHNLYFMLDLMRQAREAIKEDKFQDLLNKWK